ncbi:MAG: antifreeze protein [Gemmobacter sp.]
MPPIFDPAAAMRLAFQSTMMLHEAQMVIAMRLMGLGGGWRVAPSENARMVTEKAQAMVASGMAAGRAVAAGASPQGVALAALKPVRTRTRANARRLTKAGPKFSG